MTAVLPDDGIMLGIETSCDDTGVAVVRPGGEVVAAAVASQVELHDRYGGVYPEMASRAHVDAILPTVRKVLTDADLRPADLTAIGVTRGPGLIGSLVVGTNSAVGLGDGWGLPVYGVNHLRGHLRSADLDERRVEYPAMVLLVSGGHTLLAHLAGPGEVELVGSTRDDSVGEAYDKVARMLGLPYPGGPAIDRLAKEGTADVAFPRPARDLELDFSFSGLKSSVSRFLAANPDHPHADVAASFVDACLDVLVAKCRKALERYPSRCLVVVGGVAASPQLRAAAGRLCDEAGVSLCLPPLRWSTDNGAMIGLAAWDYLARGLDDRPRPDTSLTIADW
ncbi:tRNA (adenosine(37)-N6)-threonylcarbamoyltransferase complex transferase subunit TsaD [Actinomycetospora sp. TBRC 11914]|uniref:tRNA (adenosine(37)-N6)-threonylcarbamoyltransferase complex transferase subunit TsaD n=1 Tax=Actinomycetospora sp. TBRC 11914 TaxID=2729387 RepID=UPI00145EC08E|nr:tRNA (adenosine(37)-N6)-threonylcarbamoyltransferase complex transferase subunit TsaD [Actinomycetospora sp. TBRC 11914]NMO91289.1 tRNA (adenosine(37)-N6)-threonylcarbamoyltransferase complex transferase subunit TsaD [Actinomycetospora sp. TBRC 11914]